MAKYWSGEPPAICDMDRTTITTEFSDARLPRIGSWASMCPKCALKHQVKYGMGQGQRYQKQPDGRWKKVEG